MTEYFYSAEQTSQKITTDLNLKDLENVTLMGKNHEEKVGESDIILTLSKKNTINISLKLLKKSAFINTKSAGVNSF